MTVPELLRLIASLLVALMAPAELAVRATGLRIVQLQSVVRILLRWKARGRLLRYPGEDLATVRRRIDRILWIARDPQRALRHMARRARGLERDRFLMVAPASWAPPRVALAHSPCEHMAPSAPIPDTS